MNLEVSTIPWAWPGNYCPCIQKTVFRRFHQTSRVNFTEKDWTKKRRIDYDVILDKNVIFNIWIIIINNTKSMVVEMMIQWESL